MAAFFEHLVTARRRDRRGALAFAVAASVHVVAATMTLSPRETALPSPPAAERAFDVDVPEETPAQTAEPARNATGTEATPAVAPVTPRKVLTLGSPRPIARPHAEPVAPPPAAAQAGAVLAVTEAAPVSAEPVSTGSAAAFAGGVTASNGSNTLAVVTPTAPADGWLGGEGLDLTKGVFAIRDLSAPAHLKGSTAWKCPWPSEAERFAVDHATAHIVVDVARDGRPMASTIVDDPGSGFGPAAVRCAVQQMYMPARDPEGRFAAGATRAFAVQFDRVRIVM